MTTISKNISFYLQQLSDGNLTVEDKLLEHYYNYVEKIVERDYGNYNFAKEELIQVGLIGYRKMLNKYKNKKIKIKTFLTNIHRYITKEIDDFIIYKNTKSNKSITECFKDYFVTLDEKMFIDKILKDIDDQKEQMFKLYFYRGYSMECIGGIYGITRQRVSQIIKDIVRKIENSGEVRLLRKKHFVCDIYSNNQYINEHNIDVMTYIYNYFQGHKMEEINRIIRLLPKKDKQLIGILQPKSCNKNELSSVVDNKDYKDILTKISYLFQNPDYLKIIRKNTIYLYFLDYSEEEIDFSLSCFDDDEIKFFDAFCKGELKEDANYYKILKITSKIEEFLYNNRESNNQKVMKK